MDENRQTSIIQLSDQIASLVESLAQAQEALEAVLGDQVDAVIDPRRAVPILLSRAQQTLREAESRYRRLVGRMSAVIFELEPGGSTLFVNSAVETITGYSPEQLQGQSWWEVFFPGAQRARVDGLLRQLRSGDVANLPMPLVARDGSTVILEVNSANEYGEDGSLRRILGFGIDITERERYRQREALLYREQEARRAAEEANEFKTRLLAMVSHELRTPLTSILGFADTLLARDVEWDPQSQRDFLETIVHESEKLEELVGQLLEASRLEAGRLSVTPEDVPFAAILALAESQFGSLTSRHRLVIEAPPELPPVYADPRRVAQILANLLKNAVQYAPPDTLVKIVASQQGEYLQVDVSDEGPGIPLEARELVFEAFRQIEGRDSAKGAGLGLAICKGLVEAHGGGIWVQPDTTTGTTISFTLPLVGGSTRWNASPAQRNLDNPGKTHNS